LKGPLSVCLLACNAGHPWRFFDQLIEDSSIANRECLFPFSRTGLDPTRARVVLVHSIVLIQPPLVAQHLKASEGGSLTEAFASIVLVVRRRLYLFFSSSLWKER